MNAIWVLLIFKCFFFWHGEVDGANANSTEPNEETTQELKLFPPDQKYTGQTRMPRTLFKKLHSGAAFLAGLKLGAILSKKGFELGHGKIATTHSFQIFGKSVNSAMSLSYGNGASQLPLVEDDSESKAKRAGLNKEDQKVFHVTVIENLSNETNEEPFRKEEGENKLDEDSPDGNKGKRDDLVLLYQDGAGEDPEADANFLEEHNKRVKEFNENVFRRKNSKF